MSRPLATASFCYDALVWHVHASHEAGSHAVLVWVTENAAEAQAIAHFLSFCPGARAGAISNA